MVDPTQNTAEKPISRTVEEITKEAQRIEESACLTSKAHFIASQAWQMFHYVLGLPMLFIASVLGATAYAVLDKDNHYAGILSLILALLSALMTFLNPNEKAGNHLNAGNSYGSLENEVRIFRTIECWQNELEAILTQRIKGFSDKRCQLNASSPKVPWLSYVCAKIGIWLGEASYKVDGKK